MSESGSTKPLPPLSPAALKRVQQIRRTAIRGLRECHLTGTQLLDHASALEVLRTHAIEELGVRVGYYMALPGARAEWFGTITYQVVQSAISWFPRNEFYLRSPDNLLILEEPEQFLHSVNQTVVDHLLMQLAERQEAQTVAAIQSAEPHQKAEREAMRDAYRVAFPDAAIIDICWAAKQHRREWDRWLKYELPDGSKADRAFRLVLLSGKTTTEVRRELRPKGWK